MEQKFKFRKFRIRAYCVTPRFRGHRWYSCWGYSEDNAIADLRKRFSSAGRATHIEDSDNRGVIKSLVPDKTERTPKVRQVRKEDPLSRWHPDVIQVASTPEFATMVINDETTFASAIVMESVLHIAQKTGLSIADTVIALGYELSTRYMDKKGYPRNDY